MIYPPEIYHGTPDTNATLEPISTPLQKFLASSIGSSMKFVPLLQAHSIRAPYPGFPAGLPLNTTDGGAYIAQWAAYVQALVDDPRCLRLNGVPVVGMYLSAYMPDPMWTAFKAALNRTICLIDWNRDATNGARLGAVAVTEYPPNPGFPAGAGQHAYSEQAAIDVGYNVPIGFLTTALISIGQDSRPRNTAHSFVDRPTAPEFYAHCYAQLRAKSSGVVPAFVVLHSWNERAEDGACAEASVQGPQWREIFQWAKYPHTRPSTYTYEVNARSLALASTGTWTPSLQLASASHNNEVVTSSTAGDTRALTHVAWSGCTIYGSTAPGLGTFEVRVDGVLQTTVNQSAGSTTRHVALWTGTFAEGTHTVTVTVASGTAEFNSFGIVCNPQKF